jgi:hypothetical protein
MRLVVIEGNRKSPLRKCDMYGSKRKSNKKEFLIINKNISLEFYLQ